MTGTQAGQPQRRKGPEAESVTVAQAGKRTYAYIGLERIGGVMLYDITDPENAFFCDYINSRDFTADFPDEGTDPAQGDVSVEGICAVSAAQSPTGYPLLLAANEVSDSACYADAVLWAVEQGITSGISADTFGSNVSCTRAQIVTFLWRMMEL